MADNFEKKIDLKLILAIIATGIMSFSGVVIETAMNITFPTLMREFHITTATVQWLTTGYLLVLAIIIPTSSFLKNRFTTKSLFLTAVLLFISGIIIDASAPAFSFILFGRILQGFGTGIALPLMFNIVLEQVPLNKLGTMMGIATLVIAVSPAVGPSFGGMIINYFGWRMIFVTLLPLLVTALLLGLYSIRQVTHVKKISFDWFGYFFLAIGFASLIFATSSAGRVGWGSIQVIGYLGICIAALIIFCRHSLKIKNPIIHLSVFKYKSFTFSVCVLSLVQFICLGLGFLIPNYSQLVSGENALIAGCLLLPGCLVGAFLAPVSGRILDSLGARKPILFGNVCIMIATFVYSMLARNLTLLIFILFYILFTIGQGFTAGNSMTNGIRHLPDSLSPDGNAVCNTLQQLSGAIGTSIVATIISAEQTKFPKQLVLSIVIGTRNALWLLFLLAIVAFICSLCVFHFSNLRFNDSEVNRQ